MLETSARLLRLLSLLQTPRDWTGPQLAERLGVTTRTIRNDIERLRSLGYPVHATPGVAGGYRLGAGASLPPLLLDDEEAVAVAVGLRTAASGGVSGMEETSLRALAKLEQVLPSRLRHRVNALHAATVSVPRTGPTVDADVLTVIASAIRANERLRFDYRAHDGATTRRDAEPHRLVHTRGRWYLVAWDVTRNDWRTFRADRITPRTPNGPRFTPRPAPDGDVAAYVDRTLGTATWRHRARVKVHASATEIAARLPPAVTIEPIDDRTCWLNVGSDTPHTLALWLGMLDTDFEVADSPELAAHLKALAARYLRAAAS
ncbi:helix-turn-helix transcriptional regulator [Thermomonospora cellulosilytica]|uniref:Putative DNA-binding transcriptional regulator YafY n=1 Tax=Thermomonospora cellulosilytica TaxID=1411118 RepID=A0A7W3MUS1_9ACTN|nr:YafY family protein [Thermomonospora cellulosilytica]MBA9002303.1 putative DNA-binding transcriptional regulator YafY [Thermomonospora cellulosilytica]